MCIPRKLDLFRFIYVLNLLIIFYEDVTIRRLRQKISIQCIQFISGKISVTDESTICIRHLSERI